MSPVDCMYAGYVEAMLWVTPVDYDSEFDASFAEQGYYIDNLDDEACRLIRSMCQQFLDKMIDAGIADDFDWHQVGCDFYFTSNDHATGFIDHAEDYYGPYARELDELAQQFNEVYPYLCDGKIAIDNGGLRMTAHMLKSKETGNIMSEYDWRCTLDEFNLDDFIEV